MADDPHPPLPRGDRSLQRVTRGQSDAVRGQLVVGTVLNNTHRIEGLVAIGGMGEVYCATNLANGDIVAVKTMRPDAHRNPKIAELFRREGAALRRLRDPAIVFYEGTFIAEGGLLYLAMEFIEGPSLAELVRARPLSVDQVRRLRDRLANGLAYAHEQGVVHRDLSPQNVILPGGRLEEAKIIDFGVAKQLASQHTTVIGRDFAGKLDFAAPEQFGLFGGAVDGRTDIYSLGLVLAYAATGRPFDMGDSLASAVAARARMPDLAGVPQELRKEIATLLTPDPAKRPQSMRAIISSSEPRSPERRQRTASRAEKTEFRREAAKLGALGGASGVIAFVLVGALSDMQVPWPMSLLPGAIFGAIIGQAFRGRGLLTTRGHLLYILAASIAHFLACAVYVIAVIELAPVDVWEVTDRNVGVGILAFGGAAAGLAGGALLGGLSAVLLRVPLRAAIALPAMVGGIAGALVSIFPVFVGDYRLVVGALGFLALWQGAYAASLAAMIPAAKAPQSAK